MFKIIITDFLKLLLLLKLILLVVSCGGSGGDSGSNSPQFWFVQKTLNVDVYEYDPNTRYDSVYVDVSDSLRQKIENGKEIFVELTQSNPGFAIPTLEIQGTRGLVTIDSNFLDGRPVGIYSTDIKLKLCHDSNCSKVIGEDTLTFNFGRHALPEITTREVAISHIEGETEPATEIDIDFKTMSVEASQIRFETSYASDTQNWLDIDHSIEGNQGTVMLNGLDTRCGNHYAQLTIEFTTVGGLTDRFNVDVAYTADSQTAELISAYPRIQYANKPMQFLLKGCGLTQIQAEDFRLEGLQITGFERRDNFNIDIVTAPVSQVGAINLVLEQSSNSEAAPTIDVRSESTFAYQSFELPNLDGYGAEDLGLYDYYNDVIYIDTDYEWKAFFNDDGVWKENTNFNIAGVRDMDLSKDGTLLYVVKSEELLILDALSLEIINTYPSTIGDLTSVSETSTGNLLIGRDTRANDSPMGYFDLQSNTFSRSPAIETGYDPMPVTTLDKSKSFISSFPYPAFYRYNDETGVIDKLFDSYVNIVRSAFSQNGNRSVLFSFGGSLSMSIRDANFEEIGSLPAYIENPNSYNSDTAQDVALTKSGQTAFVLYRSYVDSASTYILEYDLSAIESNGQAQMVQRYNMGLDATNQKMFISGDENTIFIYGNKTFIVFPLN